MVFGDVAVKIAFPGSVFECVIHQFLSKMVVGVWVGIQLIDIIYGREPKID